jgi:hypothetical protein
MPMQRFEFDRHAHDPQAAGQRRRVHRASRHSTAILAGVLASRAQDRWTAHAAVRHWWRASKRVGVVVEARMDDDIDTDKIDRAVLALLYLTLHDEYRAWKGHDWDALDRLHEKGFISNPASKAKSVVFTEQGLAEAEQLFHAMFGKSAA